MDSFLPTNGNRPNERHSCRSNASVVGKPSQPFPFQQRLRVVLAFIKRRWILLSCAVVLLACSVVDMRVVTYTPRYIRCGLDGGTLFFRTSGKKDADADEPPVSITYSFHAPLMGELSPGGRIRARAVEFTVPLWLPLFVVIGGIVIREVRWRGRHSKTAEAQPTP